MRSDLFAYVRVGTILESMLDFPPVAPCTDSSTKMAAQGIGYKVVGVDLTNKNGEAQGIPRRRAIS